MKMPDPVQTQVPIFYINRNRDVTRRAAMERELARHGLSAERVVAVEGQAVPASLKAQFFNGEKLWSGLSPGEVGCYASHLVAMTLLVERGLEHAVILEDDAILSDDFVACLSSAMRQAPAGWGLMHLCQTPTHAVKTIAELPNDRRLVRCSRIPTRSQGYLVSRKGAEKFIVPRNRYWQFDVALQQPWTFGVDIFSITPAIVDHDLELESAIQPQGQRFLAKRKFRLPTAYCWTGNPLRTPQSFLYNFRKLGAADWFRCLIANRRRRVRLEMAKIPVSGARPGPGPG
jgi:glycosyl transferase, family 25